MSEWEEKLNSILSDPDAMAQIMSLAQSISGGDGGAARPEEPPRQDGPPPPPPPPAGGAPDLSSLLSQLGGNLDPELLRRMIPLLSEMNRPESGETAAFLQALRPFLRESRREKVDRAAQLARLIHLAKSFLTS